VLSHHQYAKNRQQYSITAQAARHHRARASDASWVFHPQAIYKWQHGDCLPTIDNLVALSAIFEVTIESILITEGVA
jgi:hypothetical protein